MQKYIVSLHLILFSFCGLYSTDSLSQFSKQEIIKERFEIIGADIYLQPPVALDDLLSMEPVCALVLRHQRRQEIDRSLQGWNVQLRDSHLLDLPENNIAKNVTSFHHYCWGEVVRGRFYRETDPRIRKNLVDYITSSHLFVIDHKEYRPTNWPYLSQLYVKIGTAHLLIRDYGPAINALLTAIQINPRENRAYLPLADALVDSGKKSEALKYITEGLKYFPKNKGLQRRYQEFGGKPPYPEPYPALNPEIKEEGKVTTTTPPENKNAKTPQNSEATSTSNASSQEPEKTTPNPDNPYCRFCP